MKNVMFNEVIVIGCPVTGKSTFFRKLFRTCVHKEDVRIFEHNFVEGKVKK